MYVICLTQAVDVLASKVNVRVLITVPVVVFNFRRVSMAYIYAMYSVLREIADN